MFENFQVMEPAEIRATSAGAVASRKGSAVPKQNVARDSVLDIVKGICVIVMVVYHSMEYFPDSVLDLKFVSFVSGAFIFMAGFVITNIYLKKYDAWTQGWEIFRRLALRGLKLILIAAALNLVIHVLLGPGGWRATRSVGALFYNMLTGADYHAASFILLVVIGYSLIATGFLVAISKGRPAILVGTAILFLGYALISNHFHWPFDYDARLFAIGQLGMASGLMNREQLSRLSGNLEAVVAIFFVQLLLMVVLPFGYWLYLINLLCTVLLANSAASKFNPESFVSRKLSLLGRYSLLSYLFQIAFLQCVRRVARDAIMDEWVLVVIAATSMATLGCIEVTNRLKKKSKFVDQTYKWIFN
jgi:peptidoglycan/LPS O-acetylase OafA/YrhL